MEKKASGGLTDYDLWLDSGVTDPAKVAGLMKPFDSRLMRVYPVSSTVSNVKNDGPECAEEIDGVHHAEQSSLF
jgi:putative SOS response-associated peptidase YedK